MICNISLHIDHEVHIIYDFKSQPNVISKMSEKFLVGGQLTNSGSFGVILGHNFEILRKPSKLYIAIIYRSYEFDAWFFYKRDLVVSRGQPRSQILKKVTKFKYN